MGLGVFLKKGFFKKNLFEELFDHPSSGYFLPVFFKTINAGSFFQLI